MSAGPRWAIQSYVGAGPVRLGDTVESIADAVHAEPEFIDKGGRLPTAVFSGLGLHVHLADDRRCEAIELMAPATPTFDGQPLLGVPFSTVRDALRQRDPQLTVESDGLTSEALGIGLYAPSSVELPDDPAEGVIVFVRDYYSSPG
jgi:hypothetical protein